ncbi:MAG: hypothetical protein RIB84_23675 [Sneathiellaceae bacterium]
MKRFWLAAALLCAAVPGAVAEEAPRVIEGEAVLNEGSPALELRQGGEHGPYLVDGEGRALYLFSGDRQGGPDGAAESRCHDSCALHWQPVAVPADGQVPKGPQPDLVAAIPRADGRMQLTYNGWPLYIRTGDDPAAELEPPPTVEAFGGRWSLVSPDGALLGEQHAAIGRPAVPSG